MARTLEFIPEEKIAQALEVFWSKGYHASSLADLTKAMQLNKSSFYNSFNDKHSLFIASLKAYGKVTTEDYRSALEEEKTPLENLDSIIDMIVAITTGRKNSCFGIKTSFELASVDEEAHAVIRSGHDQTISLLERLISDAQSAGQIKAGRKAGPMAHFIFNSFAGFRQSFIIYKDPALVGGMAEELKHYLRQ